MASVTITIPTPVLTPPDHFKVRYRSLPGGSWIDLPEQSNEPFTIDPIAEGNYELEVIAVVGGIECPPVITPFSVNTSRECLTVTNAYIQLNSDGSPQSVVIDFGTPAPTPPCGWIVEYNSQYQWFLSGPIVVYYSAASFPSSGQLVLPFSGTAGMAQRVRITADYCGGNQIVCYDQPIQTTVTPPCKGMAGLEPIIVKSAGQYYLQFALTQSDPPTLSTIVGYNQTSVPGGLPADSGSVEVAIGATATSFSVPIYPTIMTTFPFTKKIWYTVTMRDICGNAYSWDLEYEL